VPTLVLPPHAGHASSIVDYGRDQSRMMTLRDGGLDRLFAIDWLSATDETADWSIEGYVAVLDTSACSWAAPHWPSTGRRLPNKCGRTLCEESSKIPEIIALEHCSELAAAHSGGSMVLVQRGFEVIGPVDVSVSRHVKLGGQLARETAARNG
jgi:hypothetical protein